MIYKICYVIAQVLLYFAILEWITYRTVQKNKYCRRICSGTLMLLEGILTTITDNISNGGEVAFIFLCILGLFTYLCLTDSKNNLLLQFFDGYFGSDYRSNLPNNIDNSMFLSMPLVIRGE